MLRVGTLMSIGNLPEISSQRILVWKILAGRLGVPFHRFGIALVLLCFPLSVLPFVPARCFEKYLAQDKGGPSKGGFLNNRSCSYTDIYIYIYIYICNEINGMWIYIIYDSGK